MFWHYFMKLLKFVLLNHLYHSHIAENIKQKLHEYHISRVYIYRKRHHSKDISRFDIHIHIYWHNRAHTKHGTRINYTDSISPSFHYKASKEGYYWQIFQFRLLMSSNWPFKNIKKIFYCFRTSFVEFYSALFTFDEAGVFLLSRDSSAACISYTGSA